MQWSYLVSICITCSIRSDATQLFHQWSRRNMKTKLISKMTQRLLQWQMNSEDGSYSPPDHLLVQVLSNDRLLATVKANVCT